jgi:hypothetical protein
METKANPSKATEDARYSCVRCEVTGDALLKRCSSLLARPLHPVDACALLQALDIEVQ